MLIFLLKGILPWDHVEASNIRDANEEVLLLKNKNKSELLAGLPPNFGDIYAYLDELKFSSEPDYGKIKGSLTALMKKNGYDMDYKYDWEYL